MAESAVSTLEVGFIPEVASATLTVAMLNRTLTSVQRMVYQTAAYTSGRDEVTAAQRRDFQLAIIDAHHSNLWVILGVVAQAAADSVAKTVVETALQPLLDRLRALTSHPAAHAPIDAATLRGLVQLTEVAANSHMNIDLQAGALHFRAAPAAYATLAKVEVGYTGDVIELHGVVSEISLKRNELTLDITGRNSAIPCRFTPEQALAIRDATLIGHPVSVRGRGYWGGEQISNVRPDYILIAQIHDQHGQPKLLAQPSGQ
jgi:hypothetical protein